MLSSIQPSQLSGAEGANSYEIGTLAFQLVYEDFGILYGHITGYNSATDTYTVSYEDGTEAKYAGDSADLLVQVAVGQTYEVHPTGTLVFDEDCNPGTVETFEVGTKFHTSCVFCVCGVCRDDVPGFSTCVCVAVVWFE